MLFLEQFPFCLQCFARTSPDPNPDLKPSDLEGPKIPAQVSPLGILPAFYHLYTLNIHSDSHCGSVVKRLPAIAGDMGSIPGLGRSPRGGHGNPLQYSCLENPIDREAWWATVHGFAEESGTTERLNNY